MSRPALSQITSLRKLGVFHDYRPGEGSSGCSEFHRYNLIYGFNGTGKTIISRVFSSLETGDLNQRLPEEGSFEIKMSDKTRIRSDGPLDELKGRVVVFNTDFVEENIQWENGTASPVFYIGKKQTGLLKRLKRKEAEIEKRSRTRDTAKTTHEGNEKTFNSYKRVTARSIEERIGKVRNYRAPELARDYESYQENPQHKLEENEVKDLENVIRQDEPLAKLQPLNPDPVSLASLAEDVKKVLGTAFEKIEIEELRVHKIMMTWVRDGLHYHQENNLSECLLCGNELSKERVRKLLDSIDEERFNELTDNIRELAAKTENAGKGFLELSKDLPSSNDISKEHSSEFAKAAEGLERLFNIGKEIAETMETLLDEKTKTPNMRIESAKLTKRIKESAWDDKAFVNKLKAVNRTIEKHNASHDKFEESQKKARDKLKLHYLASHKQDYDQKEKEFSESRNKYEKSEKALEKSETEKESILKNMRSHGQATDAINKLISSYLGHEELKLSMLENGYQIQRRGMPVRGPLSEGEKTAVAFCYFLSTLESEGKKLGELIVVIDDPISSLDTKALNYAFNLIKTAVSGAKQAIIMTHNLNFMNEVKKWLKKEKNPALLFLDARRRENEKFRRSYIVELPTHLKDYESEYHYLFHLVLKFTDGEGEEYFYLMPNALRRVLEIFLAFRRPKTGKGFAGKIKELSEENEERLDGVRMQALERLVQLESHSDSIDDLIAHSSMQAEETRAAARALLDFIKALDESHYEEMRKICNEA